MKNNKQIDINQYHGYFDIQYSPVSSTCKLDIFTPDDIGPFPIVISIHGGGFKKHDKRDECMILDMLPLIKKGYAVIGINYRLSSEASFPQPVKDIKQAIRFIKDNAKSYNLNKDKIVVWGGSAGGYFTLMSALITNEKYFDDYYSSSTSSQIQGCVVWFPPTDFSKMDEQLKENNLLFDDKNHSLDDSPESLFLGVPLTSNSPLIALSNPMYYLQGNLCPMLIQHGRVDKVVPFQQSLEFYENARVLQGNKIEYDIFDDLDHDDIGFRKEENIKKIYQFIDEILK